MYKRFFQSINKKHNSILKHSRHCCQHSWSICLLSQTNLNWENVSHGVKSTIPEKWHSFHTLDAFSRMRRFITLSGLKELSNFLHTELVAFAPPAHVYFSFLAVLPCEISEIRISLILSYLTSHIYVLIDGIRRQDIY